MLTMTIIDIFDKCLCSIVHCWKIIQHALMFHPAKSIIETVHAKITYNSNRPEHVNSQKLFFKFFRSAKINSRENVPVAKIAKINSREKMVYSIYTCT